MSKENDAFSWLDNIIIQHKANYFYKEKENSQIEKVLKENLDFKYKYNNINEIIDECEKLRELNELKQKQIELLEKKIETLTFALNEDEIITQIKNEISKLYLRIGEMIQNSVNRKIDLELIEETCQNKNYFFEISKERLRAIDNMVCFLYEQNCKFKILVDSLEKEHIELINQKKNNIIETEAHFVNTEDDYPTPNNVQNNKANDINKQQPQKGKKNQNKPNNNKYKKKPEINKLNSLFNK